MKTLLTKAIFLMAATLCCMQFNAQLFDSFTDGDFTASPTWVGDTGNWEIVTDSQASTGSTGSNTLHLNVASGSGNQYLSAPNSTWDSNQTWSFFLGRRSQAYTSANSVLVWLYANESDLESATVDGYAISVGDNSGGDEIRLERIDDGVATTIITSSGSLTNGLTDIGFTVKVEKDQFDEWTLYTSVLPSSNGSGATADLDPSTESTVSEGTATDGTYAISGSAHVGISAQHSSGSNGRTTVEFDQFFIGNSAASTLVDFALPNASSVNENVGTVNLPVSILNEDGANATMVDVVLISGSAADIGGYTTQTLTFPAGSSADQNATISVTDNMTCGGNGVFVFELQSASGGNSAAVGATAPQYTLTVIDDEFAELVLLDDDFEDGDIAGWDESTTGEWVAGNPSLGAPINGSYSLHHDSNLSSDTVDYVSNHYSDACLDGVLTTWRFQAFYNNEPSTNNYFMVYLNNNQGYGAEEGYAVGVRPFISGDRDHVKLWKVENGAIIDTILNTEVAWTTNGTSDIAITDRAGFEVTRDENGLWEVKLDIDGGFDNLVSYGTPATNTDFSHTGSFELRHTFTPSAVTRLMIDDVTIQQSACLETYYSQSTGNASDAIWDDTPVLSGPMQSVTFGRFTNMVIQNTDVVTLDSNVSIQDLTVEDSSTLDLDNADLCVHGDILIQDSAVWDGATSNVVMSNDQGDQDITNNSTDDLDLYEISVNNNNTVHLNSDATIANALYPNKGDFNIVSGVDLTLLSSASNTAGIAEIKSGASVTGEITLECTVPAGNQSWVFLGTSIENQTIADWDDNLITTGFSGADYEFSEYPFVSIIQYDPLLPGFVDATNVTDPLSNTIGYWVYMLGDEQQIDATGTFNHGDEDVTVYDNAGGLNTLTNPYPCSVDWDLVYAQSTNISPQIAVYDGDARAFKFYNAMTQSGDFGHIIESGMPVVVTSNTGGGTVNWRESHKTIDGTNVFERESILNNQIEIILENENFTDHTLIAQLDEATNAYDFLYDSKKLTNTFFSPDETEWHSISSVVDENRLVENVLSSYEGIQIPLYTSIEMAGTYTIKINGVPSNQCLVLEDTELGLSYSVHEGFELEYHTDLYNGQRFILHFQSGVELTTEQNSCFNSNDASIEAVAYGNGPFEFNWYNENDELIQSASNMEGIDSMDDLTFGSYYVEVETSSQTCTSVSEMTYINLGQEPQMNVVLESGNCGLDQLGELFVSPENMSSEYQISIFNSLGELEVQDTRSGPVVYELSGNVYEVVLENECASWNYEANLTDSSSPSIHLDNMEYLLELDNEIVDLNVNPDFDNVDVISWQINGSEISNEESLNIEFDEEGVYDIILTAENGNCFDTEDISIEVISVVGLEELAFIDFTIQTFSDRIDISWKNEINGMLVFEMYDVNGRILNSKQVNGNNNLLTVPMSNLSSGLYLMSLTQNDQIILKTKVIK